MKLISFDIETDTDSSDGVQRGLDPHLGGITAIAMAREVDGSLQAVALELSDFQNSEKTLLEETNVILNRWVDEASAYGEEVQIATWNGFVFDIPFVGYRSDVNQVQLGLTMSYDPSIPVKYQPLPGFEGGYRGIWKTPSGGVARFTDIMFSYRTYCKTQKISNGLKPTARSVLGYEPISVARTEMHLLTKEELTAYAISDVDITLRLAKLQPEYGELI